MFDSICNLLFKYKRGPIFTILAEAMTSETQCDTREDRTNDTSRVSEIVIYL